jgi:hypothetical protein
VVVVERSAATEIKTKAAARCSKRSASTARRCSIDVARDDKLARSVRNMPGVAFVRAAA